jgi:cytochrome c oxidase subunit III
MNEATERLGIAPQFDSSQQQDRAATLGLWIFLATELMFFGPLFFGYVYGRLHFPQAFAVASRHTEATLGTLNTALLLTSSFTMAVAIEARKLDARKLSTWLLAATTMLGVAFLIVKGTEYRHEWEEHLFPGASFAFPGPHADGVRYFYFTYFAMTGLHAVHLFIGIVMVGIFGIGLGRGAMAFANPERIELAGLYWHFIDAVWIFLYPILYLVGRAGG